MNQRLWTPAQLAKTHGLMWWDAAHRPSISQGTLGRVTQWKDRVSGVSVFDGASPSGGPILRRDFRGPYLDFVGQEILQTAQSTLLTKDATSWNVFVVGTLYPVSSWQYDRIVSFAYSGVEDYNSNGTVTIPLLRSGGAEALIQYRYGAERSLVAYTSNTHFVASSMTHFDGTTVSMQLRVNGVAGALYTIAQATALTQPAIIAFGARANSFDTADSMRGTLREVLWVQGQLDEATRYRLEGYLAHKWTARLANGHTYARRVPLVSQQSSLFQSVTSSSVRLRPTFDLSSSGWSAA